MNARGIWSAVLAAAAASGAVESPMTPNGRTGAAQLVAITLSRVGGISPAGRRLTTPNQVDLSGGVQEQPLGSEIRAGARCAGEMRWGLIGGAAQVGVNGEWRMPGVMLLASPVRKNRFCDIVVFVASPLGPKTSLDDAELRQVAYKVSAPVPVEVDASLSQQPDQASVEVLSISGHPADPAQTTTVPPSFDVHGVSRNLARGERVWLAGACGEQPEWTARASGAVEASGAWSISGVRFDGALPGSGCRFVALAGGSEPPGPAPNPAALERKSAAHSAVYRIVWRPLSLEIESVTERTGRVHVVDEELQTNDVIALGSDVVSYTVVGDSLSPDLRVSIVVSGDRGLWLGFDPAALESPGVWLGGTVGLTMPGLASGVRTIKAVVSRAPLYGRALTNEELNAGTLGQSPPLTVSAPALSCQVTGIALQSVNGRDPAEAFRLPPSGGRVWVSGKERFACAGYRGMVGVVGPDERAQFTPTHPGRDGVWGQRVALPSSEEFEGRSEAELVYVVAPHWWDHRRVDAAWWEAYAAGGAGARAPILLPPASIVFRWWKAVRGTFQGGPFPMPVSILQIIGFVLALCALPFLWRAIKRQIPLLQARIIGRIHGRLGPAVSVKDPYIRQLGARREEDKSRLDARHGRSIAVLEQKSVELRRITSVAEKGSETARSDPTPSPSHGISKAFHHFAFTLMCAGDLVITIVAFRMMALEADWAVWVMSLALAVAFPLCGYFLGRALRAKSRTAVALFVLTVVVLASAIWATNEFRIIPLGAASIVAHPSLRWAFMPLHALVVLAALLLEYSRDRQEEQRQKDRKTIERAHKALTKVEERLAGRRRRLDARLRTVDAYWNRCVFLYECAFEASRWRSGRPLNAPCQREEPVVEEEAEEPGRSDRTVEMVAGFAGKSNGHGRGGRL